MEKAKAGGLPRASSTASATARRSVPSRSRACARCSTSRSTWCTTRTCGGPTASGRAPTVPTSRTPCGASCAEEPASCCARSTAPPCACNDPDGDAITTGHGPEVVVTGEPVDLLLYLFGRDGAAEVEITGDPDAQAILAERSTTRHL